MTNYIRSRITRAEPCEILLDGEAVPEGTVITDATMRDVVIRNGLIQVDYRAPSNPAEQTGANFLSVWDDAEEAYVLAVSAQFGDYFYPTKTVTTRATRMRVLIANTDVVRVAFEWDAFDLSPGVPFFDPSHALTYDQLEEYPDFKRITSAKITKTIEVRRGVGGYFVGAHAFPFLGPMPTQRETYEHETAHGERELGLGGGARVAFASTGARAWFPGFGQRTIWDDAETAFGGPIENHAFWPGVSDTLAFSQSPYTAPQQAAYAATQPVGFPAEQATGPFWVAAIVDGFAQMIVSQDRSEIGVWQYDDMNGVVVQHFSTPGENGDGRPRLFQSFITAWAYEADDTAAPITGYSGSVAYANEPSAGLVSKCGLIASHLVWPQ